MDRAICAIPVSGRALKEIFHQISDLYRCGGSHRFERPQAVHGTELCEEGYHLHGDNKSDMASLLWMDQRVSEYL